jgi:uncharacterized protein YcaQ
MSAPHRLSRAQARQIAVRAQLLDANRPSDMLAALQHLTLLQADPTNAIAPSADLVLWSRLGNTYETAHLGAALEARTVIDLRGLLRPAADIGLFRAEMAEWPGVGQLRGYRVKQAAWVQKNDFCRRDILRRLKESGPMTSQELPDTCLQPYASSGWNNNRNVVMMLDFMVQRGEVAVAGREGRDRLWDLAERVYVDVPTLPSAEAIAERNRRRLRSLGIARAKATEFPVEPVDVRDAGEPAVVEGVKGEWRVDPSQLDQPFEGRAALLSPLDRLIHDRARMADLFEFEYALEMFKPVTKRRWGYYALPVLYDDRLVGKVDATFDRKLGALRVDGVHEDVRFTKAMASAVDVEIDALARWVQRERATMDTP